ncbi:MAG TPA: TonB-dependent receptor [Verrucomicrobiales bacterium]|nr:TonB-dependent receptor [Verrucomicrobiales bacterium]
MNRILWFGSFLTVWLAVPAPAQVTEEQEPDAVSAEGGALLDTAEIYGELEKYQTWPLSASAIGGEDIQLDRIETARDLSESIPNFSMTDSGLRAFGDVMTMRGLTNTAFFSNPAVAYYIDDVPLANPASYTNVFYGLDRVEVLRGPQGTLFGKNAYAGVVNVYTIEPDNTWRGDFGVAVGEYDLYEADGWIAGPLVADTLFLRLGGAYEERDGYLHNLTLGGNPDHQQHAGAMGSLIWTPADEWRFTLSGTWDAFDDGDPRLVPLSGPIDELRSNVAGEARQESNSQAFKVEYEGDRFRVLSVTSRYDWEIDPYFFDLDLSAFPAATSEIVQMQEQWSQEIRVESVEEGGDWDWLAGLFFSDLDIDGGTERGFTVPFLVVTTTDYEIEEQSYALFTQLSYHGFQPWGLHVGVRGDYLEKEMRRDAFGFAGPVPRIELDEDYSFLSPRAGIDRDWGDHSLVYLNTGLAFKPGGFSAFVDDPGLAEFDNEEAWTTEFGIKTRCWDDRIRSNVTLFYNRIRDYQVERSLFGTDYAVINADRATSYGFEWELSVEVCEGFILLGSLGLAQAELDDFEDPLTGEDLSDNHPPFVPEIDASFGALYRHSCGFFARLEVVYQGRTFYSDGNDGRFRENGFTVVNGAMGWENKNFQVAVYGQNVFDEEYYLNMSPDIDAGSPGEPQRFGAMMRLRF